MRYQEFQLMPPLQPFVKVIWSMEDGGDNLTFEPTRILPDSCTELVIHFGDPYKTTFSDNNSSIQPQSFVVSQMKSFMKIQANGNTGFIAARFTTEGFYRFFKKSLKAISNTEVALSDIWKNISREIEDKIYQAGDMKERSRVLQSFLYSIFCEAQIQSANVIEYCIKEIRLTKGLLSIEDLSSKTGISKRQLLRQFDHYVGLSPKEFSRITKFLSSLNILAKHPSKNLTAIAYEGGYYDQAHFIHDFKEYSGLTPSEYLQSSNVVY